MKRLIAYARRTFPRGPWSSVESLDFDSDEGRLREWLSGVLRKESPNGTINGFWFGLYSPSAQESDLYVAGSDRFDLADPDWAVKPAWWPKGRYANSRVLSDLMKALRRFPAEAQGFAEWLLLLGYACLAVANLTRTMEKTLLLGRRNYRAVVVGFDDGDSLAVGQLSRSGYKPLPKPKKARLPKSPYYELRQDTSLSDAWTLDEPLSPEGKVLVSGFGTLGKPYTGPVPLKIKIHTKGTPTDFSFAILMAPIVNDRAAKVFADLATRDVQLVPLVVEGRSGKYFLLNLTRNLDAVDWKKAEWLPSGSKHRYIAKLALKTSAVKDTAVFRVKEGSPMGFVVSAKIAEAMDRAKLTGASFSPVPSF